MLACVQAAEEERGLQDLCAGLRGRAPEASLHLLPLLHRRHHPLLHPLTYLHHLLPPLVA